MGTIASLDLETTSLDPHKGSIILASWCGTDLVPHARPWSPSTRAKVISLVSNPKNTIITQNGVFDYSWLAFNGIEIRAKYHDTMVGSHVIESNQPANLFALVQRYLVQEILDQAGIDIQVDFRWKKEGPDAWIKENKRWFKAEYGRVPHMGDVPIEIVTEYGKKDALYTLLVWFAMRDFITKRMQFSYKLDLAMIPIVVGMKCRGIPIDIPLCRKRIKELRIEQNRFLKRFKIDKVGPLALRSIIFPKLGIPLRFKTEKGNWKFDERTLRRYQVRHPRKAKTLEKVIQYRKAKQSEKTYYQGYLDHSWRRKIFPTFNITNARTGRFSSSAPNLQNVKKKGDERKVFLVRPGFINIHWDYDQIELRLLAHYSGESRLLEIFEQGIDPHTRTAELMEVNEKTIKRFLCGKYRRMGPRAVGKDLNYAYWYGLGIDRFSLDLGLKRKKGAELFARYREAYPDAIKWSKNLISTAKQVGYVQDIFGRRYSPVDRYSFYTLVNYLIQGTAAQAIKIGMLRVQKLFHRNKRFLTTIRNIPQHTMRAMQLLTIHDEIGTEIIDKREKVEPIIRRATKALTFPDTFALPLTVSTKWTRTNWGELKEVSEEPIPWN